MINRVTNSSLDDLIAGSHGILDEAIRQTRSDGREIAGIVILFSGGNDSTTLAHMFRDRATHTAHANTGIGIEQTRQFVRDTSALWGLPLIEKHPRPGETYADLILGRCMARTGPNKGKVIWGKGFPGPASHWLMYQRLKERCLEQVRNELVTNPRRERVIFLAGRRADESGRRRHLADVPSVERKGSTVWVSPLVHWTKADLLAYRQENPDIPRNEISDIIHMSGECLCGAFAHPGELEELEFFGTMFGNQSVLDAVAQIKDLQKQAGEAGVQYCQWGWGAYKEKPSKTGALCSSCDARFEAAQSLMG